MGLHKRAGASDSTPARIHFAFLISRIIATPRLLYTLGTGIGILASPQILQELNNVLCIHIIITGKVTIARVFISARMVIDASTEIY